MDLYLVDISSGVEKWGIAALQDSETPTTRHSRTGTHANEFKESVWTRGDITQKKKKKTVLRE